jgi:hypothetical protein
MEKKKDHSVKNHRLIFLSNHTVEYLPSKDETLSSNPSTDKRRKKKSNHISSHFRLGNQNWLMLKWSQKTLGAA